jgi:chemotaxis protein methyltransferase CheR/two-component system CheB/CheR fusion protein
MLDKYGHADGAGNWRPVVRIRSRMRWKVADLLQTVEAGPWDVILWRNAGMYLNPDAAAAIGRRLVAHLSPGGFLVLGKAERPPDCGGLAAVHRCIFTKRSDG